MGLLLPSRTKGTLQLITVKHNTVRYKKKKGNKMASKGQNEPNSIKWKSYLLSSHNLHLKNDRRFLFSAYTVVYNNNNNNNEKKITIIYYLIKIIF